MTMWPTTRRRRDAPIDSLGNINRRVMARMGRSCVCCGLPATQLIGQEFVCDECADAIHADLAQRLRTQALQGAEEYVG